MCRRAIVRRVSLGLLSAGLVGLFLEPATAKLRSIPLNLEQSWPAPRWQWSKKDRNKVKAGTPERLMRLKEAELSEKWSDCVRDAKALRKPAPGLRAVLAVVELRCSRRWSEGDEKGLSHLDEALRSIQSNPQWLAFGAQVDGLRKEYPEALLVALEKWTKKSRKNAWSKYDHLQTVMDWLSQDQKARLWRLAGELAFVEQNLVLAVDLLNRSLSQKDSAELRRRVEALRASALGKKSEPTAVAATSTPAPRLDLPLMNADEEPIVTRMKRALDSGELLAAVQDGVTLIRDFPGGIAARWASDKILEVYLSLGARDGADAEKLRQQAVKHMLDGDGPRLLRWAMNASAKGYYADALRLAEAAVKALKGQSDLTRALALAGDSALHAAKFSEAEDYWVKLRTQHHGSEEAREATLRLGLLYFRQKRWSDSAAQMERLLAQPDVGDWRYLALYWHWRAQQKAGVSTASQSAEQLVKNFPITYYGLRARAELNGGTLTLPAATQAAPRMEWWLSQTQAETWERFQLLLQAGWFLEAQAELEHLPEPQGPEEKILRARLQVAAFAHDPAFRTFNDVWTSRPDWLFPPLVQSAFPTEYSAFVESEAKAQSLQPELLLGLMRQESSFRPDVISPARAHGVMQLLPATAREVAQGLKIKSLTVPEDLFKPELNIRLGSTYLARLLRAYGGHVPLALAAYNAGPGRLRRWLQSRTDLGDVEKSVSSAPEAEIWIDELPWSETRLYVRAILRNLLIYELLGKNELKLPDPVWR